MHRVRIRRVRYFLRRHVVGVAAADVDRRQTDAVRPPRPIRTTRPSSCSHRERPGFRSPSPIPIARCLRRSRPYWMRIRTLRKEVTCSAGSRSPICFSASSICAALRAVRRVTSSVIRRKSCATCAAQIRTCSSVCPDSSKSFMREFANGSRNRRDRCRRWRPGYWRPAPGVHEPRASGPNYRSSNGGRHESRTGWSCVGCVGHSAPICAIS